MVLKLKKITTYNDMLAYVRWRICIVIFCDNTLPMIQTRRSKYIYSALLLAQQIALYIRIPNLLQLYFVVF